MTRPRYFDPREVAEALPIDDCVEAMRAALIATSRNRVQQPPRMIMPMPDGAGLALMPGFLQDRPLVGTKVVARFSPSEPQGRHRKAGVFLLFDRDTAQLRAIIDAHSLTNRRTAATTVAAVRRLVRLC
ncbi:MAG TPA: hypothetical protein VM491_02275, partial [Burkholderiaceae bacterium]|nr:hypothetical protein [Burkholderiaceae bacterium]